MATSSETTNGKPVTIGHDIGIPPCFVQAAAFGGCG
jgi:hypothetical protein